MNDNDEVGIDTDIVLKSAAWGIGDELLAVLWRYGKPATLGVVHIIAAKQLKRLRLRDRDAASGNLDRLLAHLGQLEPSDSEATLAAELTAQAQLLDLPLDPGEAQLAAITSKRPLVLLATGDKRAISALARMGEYLDLSKALEGRITCLEQILSTVAVGIGNGEVRSRVCAEPEVDGALRLACSCDRDAWDQDQLDEALASFVSNIRTGAGRMLVEGSVLA